MTTCILGNGLTDFVRASRDVATLVQEHVTKAGEFACLVGQACAAVEDLIRILGPGHARAAMCLTEMQNLLQRCWDTTTTCYQGMSSYADMSSGRVAQEIRLQLQRDDLEPQLVGEFLNQVNIRLGNLRTTTRRFKALGTVVEIGKARSQLRSLESEQNAAECVADLSKAVKFVFKMVVVGGCAYLAFQCLPAAHGIFTAFKLRGLKSVFFEVVTSKAAISKVSTAFLTLLGLGAADSIADDILQGVQNLETKLSRLTEGFMSVFEQLHTLDTAMHGILECGAVARNALKSVRDSKARLSTNKYEYFGLQDSVESFLDCLQELKGKLEVHRPSSSFASSADQARAVKAKVEETTACVKVTYDVMSRMGRLLGTIATWIAETTGVVGVLNELWRDVYDDKLSQTRLRELRNLLQRCTQLLASCSGQIRSCSAIATEPCGQRIKEKIKKGSLGINVVGDFVNDLELRLDEVRCKLAEFQHLGCEEAKVMAKEEAERLETKMRSLTGKSQTAKGVQMATRFVAGYGLTCVTAVSVATGTFPLAAVFAGAVGWGAIEAGTKGIIDKISTILGKVSKLVESFKDVHKDIDSAQTSMHCMSECVHRMNSNLDCVRGVLRNPQVYRMSSADALMDGMEQLLKCLIDIE